MSLFCWQDGCSCWRFPFHPHSNPRQRRASLFQLFPQKSWNWVSAALIGLLWATWPSFNQSLRSEGCNILIGLAKSHVSLLKLRWGQPNIYHLEEGRMSSYPLNPPKKVECHQGERMQDRKLGNHLKVTKLIEGTGADFMDIEGLLNTTLSDGFICHHPTWTHTFWGFCNWLGLCSFQPSFWPWQWLKN